MYAVSTVVDDVRLVGGTSSCTGTLEMQHQGEWRAVDAGFHWNLKSSSVVCRQLDCGSAVSTERSSGFTQEPVWRITPYCAGSEHSLSDCVIMETSHSTQKALITGRPTVNCSGNSTMTYSTTPVFTVSCFYLSIHDDDDWYCVPYVLLFLLFTTSYIYLFKVQ